MLNVGQRVYVPLPVTGEILHLRVSQIESEAWGEVVEGEKGYMYTVCFEYIHTGTKGGRFIYDMDYSGAVYYYRDKLPSNLFTSLKEVKLKLKQYLKDQIEKATVRLDKFNQQLKNVDYTADKQTVLEVKEATGKSLNLCLDAVIYSLGDREKAIKLTKYLEG